MKYLRIYISITYFIMFSVLYLLSNILEIKKLNPWDRIDWGYYKAIPFIIYMIIGVILTIIFFVYLLRIKNNFLFYSVLCLAIVINIVPMIIAAIILNISKTEILIGNFLGLIVPIGLIILSLYFRDKYKKSIN